MAVLKDLLKGVAVTAVHGDGDARIDSVTADSRTVTAGTLFVAVKGTVSDGHEYIARAVENGAAAVVCEKLPDGFNENVAYVQVKDSASAAGYIASAFYGDPSSKLKVVGVTGTNGKTTTATLLYEMFRRLGYKAGLISTVVYRIHDREREATHTTPDSMTLNSLLAEMADAGCEYCFMEVSSHSTVQHRVDGIRFAGAVFTNITHDHLDYHGTFAEYIKAKKMFFDSLPKDAFALINIDDRNGRVVVQNTKAPVRTYSLCSPADFNCRIVEMHFDGMLLNIDSREVWVRMTGRFNAYNLLSVYAASVLLGADREEALKFLSGLPAVRGRFEQLRSDGGVTAIVDYAHTPDALRNVMDTIDEIKTPFQKLYTVVGCGGNRDTAKRAVMGKIAAERSDLAILTSDNPRFEDPDSIIEQMADGVDPSRRALKIADRREAIRTAVAMACEGDIILVAGKGHETYQDVAGAKNHFDDMEELREAFGRYGVPADGRS